MPELRRQAVAARMGSVLPHFDALFNDDRVAMALHRIEAPMLLLTGASTVASTRRIGELLCAALPRAEHALLPGMRHMGPVTHADEVNRRIAGFLQRQSPVRMPGIAARSGLSRFAITGRCRSASPGCDSPR